jgi:hypothetical protein
MTKARDLSKLLSTANGKIAGANLDVSFENISDTGTAGTKVASGTTNQRGSTAGQIRFNTTTGLAEYYTGSEFKVIDAPPTVTAVSPLEVDSQAGGNITFTITGSNFGSGAVTKFIGSDATEITASTTTVNSGSSISAVIAKSSFVGAKEPYDVKVINVSGLSGILDNQINIDNSPAWNTASGTVVTINDEATGTHATVSATDADGDTISYSETGGTVLTTAGLTLNSSTGAISGDPTNVGSSTTYSFNLRATANSKTTDRAFNIIVTPALLENNANTLAFFDFASGASYDGSSTLQDRTSRNKDLPIGSSSYSSANGGVLIGSSTQNVRTTGLTSAISEVSMGLWVKLDGSTNRGIIYYGDTSNDNHFFVRDGINGTAYNFDVGKDISGGDNWTRSKYNGSNMSNYITGVSGYASKFWYYVVRINSSGVVTCSLNKSTFETVENTNVNMSGHSSGQFGIFGDPYDDNASSHTIGVAWWYNGLIPQAVSDRVFDRYATRFGY